MRRLVLALLVVGGLGSPAPAQQTMSANERAYTLAVMCAAVAKHFHNEADQARALDAANRMASALQYSFTQLSLDLDGAETALAKQQRANPDMMDQRRETCRRIRLAE